MEYKTDYKVTECLNKRYGSHSNASDFLHFDDILQGMLGFWRITSELSNFLMMRKCTFCSTDLIEAVCQGALRLHGLAACEKALPQNQSPRGVS